jgi:hypothetical protein
MDVAVSCFISFRSEVSSNGHVVPRKGRDEILNRRSLER